MRYFITFSCYGSRLHGDEAGSVDPAHNLPGSPVLEGDPRRVAAERRRMKQNPYTLGTEGRAAVLAALLEVCHYRGWSLLAAHVRTNHVHAITEVEMEVPPEKVLNDFKAYSTRALNRAEPGNVERKRWARHGSTRWLWKDQDVQEAIRYVVEGQGEAMAVYVGDLRW